MNTSGYQIIGVAIAAAIAAWVYTDAKKRGMNAIGWSIGTFLVCIVFLPLYLILRKPVGWSKGAAGMPAAQQPMPLPPTYTQTPGYPQPPQSTTPPPTYPPPAQPTFQPPPPTFQPPQAGIPGPPAAAPKQGRFCPNCGAPHEGTVKFCANCGAAI